jgi:hypothetical protein
MADPTPWTGIVVRCNQSENGNVPRSASSNSPDIIMGGTTPLEDPSILTNPSNYSNSYSNQLYIGQPNYLYVRGKNFTAGALSGSWNLFYATPNILLYPYLWESNQLATSSGNQNPAFNIAAGAIGASEDAFFWVPADTSDHYCMVAIANTPEHGNPLAGVSNITSLADILTTNANIAQRNVQMIRGNLPTVVTTAAYNQGSEAAKIDLTVVFNNLPKGSSYTVSSGTPLNGKALSHSDSNTQDNDFKYAWTNLDIPANWNTMFAFSVKFGSDWSGIPAGQYPSFEIRGELVMDSSHRLYHLGVEADQHLPADKRRKSVTGGPVKVLVAGSVKTDCPDVKK